MVGLSVIVLPQWRGSVWPLARQLVSGAARLAALARAWEHRCWMEPGGFSAERSVHRCGRAAPAHLRPTSSHSACAR